MFTSSLARILLHEILGFHGVKLYDLRRDWYPTQVQISKAFLKKIGPNCWSLEMELTMAHKLYLGFM